MNTIKKKPYLKMVAVGLALMVLNINAFSRIHFNGSGTGYGEGDDGAESSVVTGNIIEMYVVEGAGHFLEAQSAVHTFLNRFELQETRGIDYNEMRQIAERALENTNRTLETYGQLIKAAEETPYNPLAVEKLTSFDYAGFMKEHKLVPSIFKKVEGYLSSGDITGAFKRVYASMESISRLLTDIRDQIASNKLPPVETCWELNERCYDVSLFGGYAARVFGAAF